MKLAYWFLLILSAILYTLPFLYISYFWWLIFIFPIPFFYVASHHTFSFIHGFVWSLCVFSLHMSGGICVVMHMASAPLYGFCVALSIIALQALFAGLLFFSIKLVRLTLRYFFIRIKKLRANGFFIMIDQETSPYKLCISVIILFLFITWIDRYCLCMFDVIEGYPLMHPLLMLTHYPSLLWLLPIIGKNCLTFFFLLSSATIILFSIQKNIYNFLWCCVTAIPWLLSFFINIDTQIPRWIQRIKPIPYMMINQSTPSDIHIKNTLQDLHQYMQQYNKFDFFISPESAITLMDDIKNCDFSTMRHAHHKHLIFGVSHIRDNNCYNSLCYVYNGQLCYFFDKQHAMLLSERLPTLLKNNCCKQLFFNNSIQQTNINFCKRKKIDIDSIKFIPYICSELFFSEHPDDTYHDTPILVIVNDSVFLQHTCSRYICTLLHMLAQFKAIQWQREIVYVSYSQSFYVNKYGKITWL
jgi:hypothetical protein